MSDLQKAHEKTWAMVCHLGAFSCFLIPMGNIVVPLIIWLMKKDESGFINEHGKQSLNFQISFTIYTIIAAVLSFILIGFLILPVIFVLDIIFIIQASIKANNGEMYNYPMSIRFIK